jgi:dTDP-glucose 4,6-dehydratase
MSHNLRIMVTGGCGFIGSAVCRYLASLGGDVAILNFDAMTYAASETSLADIQGNNAYSFVKGDVADAGAVAQAIAAFKPTHIMHLAAESHVDRSITGPGAFIQTNVIGTYVMLQAALEYWRTLDSAAAEAFRFHHISTDEVFGSLGAEGCSPRRRPTTRARPIRHRRLRPTTWSAPGITPMACRWWSPTARTITAPITSPRS